MTLEFISISRGLRLLIAATFLIAPLAVSGQVSVVPAKPRPQETVRVQVAPLPFNGDTFDPRNRHITMAGNRITVDLLPPDAVFIALPPPTQAVDIVLGQFPTGDYQVEVRLAGTQSVGSAAFSVLESDRNGPVQNNTDLWWNPNESGWGLNIIQHGGSGLIFATWFDYASDGRAVWYVIPEGQWVRSVEFRGPIYRTTGPQVDDTFNPAAVTRTLVGNAVLTFVAADSNRMTAVLTVDGKTVTKQLQRQGF